MKLKAKEIADAIGGVLTGKNVEITYISTDTRTIVPGSLFIPLKGEKFDGHRYISTAVEKGAVCILTQEDGEYDVTSIRVKNTHDAMGDIARYYRKKHSIPVVGITGSVGKTTTKDMIANVLAQKYNVLKTEGNFNNDIGVPLTLFRLEEEHQCAVIEMGMNHFGEISYLTKIALPDVAVITNVGVSHIENLGSREGILKAKCEIFEGMKADALKVLNGDNDMLSTVKDKYQNVCCFSMNDSSAAVYADNITEKGIEGISCVIHTAQSEFAVNIPIPGRHMVSNAMAAAAVGTELGLTTDEIKTGIESFRPTGLRMAIEKTDRFTIINDVYNANPASVEAGIDVLTSVEKDRCCILGDMFELGTFAEKMHKEVGEYAAEKNIEVIICIGSLSKAMYKGALEKGGKAVYYFESIEDFKKQAPSILYDGMTMLVKASRGMHFEEITEFLKNM